MALTVVQATHAVVGSGGGATPNVTLPLTPTVGNVVVIFFSGVNNFTTFTAPDTGWNVEKSLNFGNLATTLRGILYRYVQPGDTTALLNIKSGYVWQHIAIAAVEISGVGGTWSSDRDASSIGQSVGSFSSTAAVAPLTTANKDEMCLLWHSTDGNDAQTSPATVSSGWNIDDHLEDGYWRFVVADQTFPTASSSTSETTNFPGSTFFNGPWFNLLTLIPSAAVLVPIGGVSAAAAAEGVTFDVGANPVGVDSPALAGGLGAEAHVAGVASAAIAGAVVAEVSSTLTSVTSAAAAGNSPPGPSTEASGASASSAVGSLGIVLGPQLRGASAAGLVRFVYANPQAFLPVFTIMRNTAVPAVGSMANTPVAVAERLLPSGPQPYSIGVNAVGVSARAHAATIVPVFYVRTPAQAGASSAAVAGGVGTAVT